MKILICGAGYIAQELLKRLGESWKATLVDRDESILRDMSARFVSVVRVLGGDASSPVVLDRAGLGEQDYVLALTRDDASNLAVVTFAREKGIRNVLSLVYDPKHLPDFEKLGVRTMTTATQAARRVHQYLLDPRVNVFSIGQDEAEFMEVDVGDNPDLEGRRIEDEKDRTWRVVGILRNRRLMFPQEDTEFRRGDRLLLLGGAISTRRPARSWSARTDTFPGSTGTTWCWGCRPARAGRGTRSSKRASTSPRT